MDYIDGFVAAVPSDRKEDYIEFAQLAAKVFKENGALRIVECWGDDIPQGEVTSFPLSVQLKEDETVVFSWVVWPSREVRDEAYPKIEADPRIQPDVVSPPFDGKRMIYGGFNMIVDE
ncbi:MAG: DUF1428 domain-containing protein [Pseudomonadales bacterium]|nr:DUF1428 domain-containing protein [Pseudomonadales bacterium]